MNILSNLVGFSARRPWLIIAIGVALAAASIAKTIRSLGVTTDTGTLFSSHLPWTQRADALAHLFPQNDLTIVAVIDGQIPEEAEAAAARLAQALRADHAHIISATQPDALPYFQKNAFLLISQADLEQVLQRTTDAQPFLGPLVADPTMRGLFSALGLVVQGVAHHQDVGGMSAALAKFHIVLRSALAGQPTALSWQLLLGGKLAEQAGRYRFVLIKPVLDYSALQPGGAASDVVRKIAASLPEVAAHMARVRLTGQVVLNDEEFASVAQGAVAGLIGSFVLVIFLLFLAVRSWRLMLPITATLLLGLALTTGFAALAIGTLNLVSVAFAVLFVGIAVDFAIQFSVRFREQRHAHPMMQAALRATATQSGAQILVAALATAAGFMAFAPTDFKGVAQLGIIAGAGMMIAFICTLSFLPALLGCTNPQGETAEVGFTILAPVDAAVRRARWPVVGLFTGLACIGLIAITGIHFDGDPLDTKNQQSEAIKTLKDLMEDPLTNPYAIQAVMPSLAEAQAAAARYAALPLTDTVLTLQSFIPDHQAEKLAEIQDAASLLASTLAPPLNVAPATPESLRAATRNLENSFDAIAKLLKPTDPLWNIRDDVRALASAPDATIMQANTALTQFLPLQLARLRLALSTQGASLADMPASLRDSWILPDGRALVEALPKTTIRQGDGLHRWAQAAIKMVPQSSGSAVYIFYSANTIIQAFLVAAAAAILAITVILALALRRALDVALVLIPLLFSAMLTGLLLRAFGLDLNFANIIALPLLLGVGVSFNIYFVMNWRAGATHFIDTATARAVIFSAATTSTAFGSLALSQHPGTASMGILLLMSLGCTVITSLLFVPAMLALMPAVKNTSSAG